VSNNNGSRYLIKSREQKRKLSPLYKERMFSVCFLWFRNAFSYLESDGVQLTRTHSKSRFWAGGRKGSFSTSEIIGRKISFLLLIFLGFLSSRYPNILFSSREMSAYWWGKNNQTCSGAV